MPVEVIGLSGVPMAGESFFIVSDERRAREIASNRQTKQREIRMSKQRIMDREGLFGQLHQEGQHKVVNIVLKADVHGSTEALADALEQLSTPEIIVKVVGQGVGGINESDVTLCMAAHGLLIGFNVRADVTARRLAESENIPLHYFSIIYEVLDTVKLHMTGLLKPHIEERIVGLAEVRDVFRSPKFGAVAGCMVIEGTVKRGYPIRVLRDNVVIYQGELESLRRFKEDASEVRHGTECGIAVKNYNDVRVGDQIETYERVEVLRSL
jgi:translation initiation factor IF-2